MKHRGTGLQSVSFSRTSVEDMLNWPNPATILKTSNSPIDPRESQAFTVQGDLWRAKIEGNDCDFHLEITAPGNGKDADRVIVEIPQGAPFTQIRNTLIEALINAGEGDLSQKSLIDLKSSIPIQVGGFAFFDAFHYSKSNPKRGHGHGTAMVGTIWELHPVWQLSVPVGPAPAVTAAGATPVQPTVTDPQDAYDFSISKSFLEALENAGTIQYGLNLQLGNHSGIHPLESDCEMHVVGTAQGAALGWPGAVIVEPPNLCRIDPEGNESSDTSSWLSVFDDLQGSTCQVTGYPRIFTEHATGGSGASNPNHVFEVHPALSVACGDQKLSFANFLRVYPGMRAISPSTTTSCISDRQLEVRFEPHSQQYLFREHGGRCGNFAIVEVDMVYPKWVHAIDGGHTAIARVSPDGQTTTTLKLYTLAPSAIDSWLGHTMTTGTGTDRKLVHGLFTYDYFAIQKTVHPKGGAWQTSPQWMPVKFPIALVVFGETDTAPWEEP